MDRSIRKMITSVQDIISRARRQELSVRRHVMAEKKYDVIHIGEANHDIRIPDVPDDYLTGEAETYLCGRISDGCGGDALNQAICLAALGDHSAFYGRLHAGYPGTRLRDLLKEHGVDTSLTIMAEDCHTPDIVVTIMKDGRHRFLVGRRDNWGLKREEIDLSVFASARVLAIGSLFVLDSLDRDGLMEVLQTCRENGVPVVADMTFDIHSLGPAHYDPYYKYIDYMVPSREEALYVTGETDERKMAEYFLSRGAGTAVIKLGSRGSYCRNSETEFYMAPYQIQPVDTTGCGDNFTAGFIHALLKGLPLKECVRFASAAGSLNALGVGSSSFIRSEQMVLDFMKTTPQAEPVRMENDSKTTGQAAAGANGE